MFKFSKKRVKERKFFLRGKLDFKRISGRIGERGFVDFVGSSNQLFIGIIKREFLVSLKLLTEWFRT